MMQQLIEKSNGVSFLFLLCVLWSVSAWAQPSTPVLDDFTHSNNPLSDHANWGGAFDAATTDLRSSSGSFVDTSGTPTCSTSIYDATTFGPEMEAYSTHQVNAGSDNRLFVRIQSPFSSAVDGYYANHSCGSSQMRIYRVDNGASTQLGGFVTQSCTAGDKWLLRISGSTLTLEYNSGGTWVVLTTRTDSTYTGVGYIGIGACASSEETDFGGGTLGGMGGGGGGRRRAPSSFGSFR